MGTFFLIIAGCFLLFFFWEFPALTVVVVILIIAIGSCSDIKIEDVEAGLEQILPLDETPKATETPDISVPENSVQEKCIDGKIYLLIIENGENFTATKEDIFGYPVKCSE